MDIGIRTVPRGRLADPAAVRALAAAAEQLGYSSLWVADPGPPGEGPPALDPVPVLAATAAATSRLRLGTEVVVHPAVRPALVARTLRSLHLLSDRRLTTALRVAAGPGPAASRVVEQVLDLVDGDRRGPVVLLGGRDVSGHARALARADGWYARRVPVAALAPCWAHVRALAADAGRDPGRLLLVVDAEVALDAAVVGARRSYAGALVDVVRDLGATRQAGASEVILGIAGDPGLDEALDTYARVAEAVEALPGA